MQMSYQSIFFWAGTWLTNGGYEQPLSMATSLVCGLRWFWAPQSYWLWVCRGWAKRQMWLGMSSSPLKVTWLFCYNNSLDFVVTCSCQVLLYIPALSCNYFLAVTGLCIVEEKICLPFIFHTWFCTVRPFSCLVLAVLHYLSWLYHVFFCMFFSLMVSNLSLDFKMRCFLYSLCTWGRGVLRSTQGGGHLFSHLFNICIALCMVDGLLHGELRGCLVCCGFHCSYPKIGEIFHTKYVGYIEAYPDTHSSSLSIQCSVFCVSFYYISTFCFQ